MALLQVFTGTACNNKTGCIGQPTYAESVIHETSGKRKGKKRVNDGVNKCQLYHKPVMAISKPASKIKPQHVMGDSFRCLKQKLHFISHLPFNLSLPYYQFKSIITWGLAEA